MSIGDVKLTDGTEQVQPRTPLVSLLLAYAATVPTAAAAAAVLLAPSSWRGPALRLGSLWAGAVLCFLAGVRRGLSFRQPGGSTVSEIGATVSLFSLGAGSLVLPRGRMSLLTLVSGFVLLGVDDVRAARRDEAPRYFARIRPVQLLVPLASLSILLWRAEARSDDSRDRGTL